jgi:hypothetical protein
VRPEADQGSASFWPLLRLRLRLEPSSASKVGMTGEKVTSDDRRKRCVDNVEGDEVELVTGGCVSKAAVDSADAFHTAAAIKCHVDRLDKLGQRRREKIERQDVLVGATVAERAKVELESPQTEGQVEVEVVGRAG